MKALVLVLLLTGCVQTDGYRNTIIEQAAQISDRAVQDAEFVLCRAISVGAWRRAYGNDSERAGAWRVLCSDRVTATP